MRVAGIQIEKDRQGNPAFARINLKKHGEAIRPYLEQVGAVEEDEFEKKWKRRIPSSEVRKAAHKHIDKLFKNGR